MHEVEHPHVQVVLLVVRQPAKAQVNGRHAIVEELLSDGGGSREAVVVEAGAQVRAELPRPLGHHVAGVVLREEPARTWVALSEMPGIAVDASALRAYL